MSLLVKQEIDITEGRLQQKCFMWHWNTLTAERGRLILMYNNPRSMIAATLLKGMGMREGMADLLYLRKPMLSKMMGLNEMEYYDFVLPHFLECKLIKGVQSKAQKEFESKMKAIGWRYDIFRSLQEFQELIWNTSKK